MYGRGNIDIFGTSSNPIILTSSSLSGNAGSVSFAATGGGVNLTNLTLKTQSESLLNGGAISFATAVGNINLIEVPLYSASYSILGNAGNTGNGGLISFATNSGNINLMNSPMDSSSLGNGGPISFATTFGKITVKNSILKAQSESLLSGGAISFSTTSGNIDLQASNLYSSSYSLSNNSSITPNTGISGPISFSTTSGNINLTTSELHSESYSEDKNGGNGGPISIKTNSGNITLVASKKFSLSESYPKSGVNNLNGGDGGLISFITNSGNIDLKGSGLSSYSSMINLGRAGKGGQINLSARGGSISGDLSTDLKSFSVSTQGESGKGGDVTLEAGTGISGLNIITISSGDKSGDVKVSGSGHLLISNTNIETAQKVDLKFSPASIPTTINLGSKGQAGDVIVAGNGNLNFKKSLIQSDTRSDKPAGNIIVSSPSIVSFLDSQIISNTSGRGKAGDVNINAPIVKIIGISQIKAETKEGSLGKGGSISLNAPTAVELTRTADGIPIISVESSGLGKAGDITIDTQKLMLSDSAKITATTTQASSLSEGGGSVNLNASTIDLAGGTVGVFAETQGQSQAGRLTLKPYNNQPNLNILFQPGSIISAKTSSSGKGGDLVLTAPQLINLDGAGTLSVGTTGSGDAGKVLVSTSQLNMTNGVQLVGTTTSSGQGGSVVINSPKVSVTDGSIIAVNSTGIDADAGRAGDLTIIADTLILDRYATLNGTSESGKGGDITLNVGKYLLLRHNSLISTSAGASNQGTADGGNISVNTKFIIAAPRENSDIAANAFGGTGGKVNINASNLYWISRLSRQDLARRLGLAPNTTAFSELNPSNLPPDANNQNDITAISQSDPTLNGSVILNALNPDVTKGLGELNLKPIDTSQLIAQGCVTGKRFKLDENKFVVTGRSGIPATPGDVFRSSGVLTELGTPFVTDRVAIASPVPIADSPSPDSKNMVEAQGWIVGPNGKIRLVAQSQSIPQSATRPTCPQ